jgi:ribokinase
VRLVAVGEVMVDIVCSELPLQRQRTHGKVSIRAGGSTVNAAACAVSLGEAATVVGRVGADSAGDLVVASLRAAGIEAHLARDEDLPTGVAVALGSAESVSVVADRAANARLSPADVPDPLAGEALLVSGFALFQSGSREAARTALDRYAGDWAAVDLASPKLASSANLDEVARGARVIFATAEEARGVTGLEPADAARALAARFPIVCVKLGEEGALVAQGTRTDRRGATPVQRRSPFGAGDAFAASFLLSMAHGESPEDALERACEAGARWSSASSRC